MNIDQIAETPSSAPRSQRRIRLKEVLQLVPLGRSTIYDRMEAGTFPKSYDLGGGVVCWRESDILDWLDRLPEKGGDNNLGVS